MMKISGNSHSSPHEVGNPMMKKGYRPLVVVLAGPTAVGKSAIASRLCTPSIASRILLEHSRRNDMFQYQGENYVQCDKKKIINTTFEYDIKNSIVGRGHVISADSVQVCCGMDIGANKPTLKEKSVTPHHLIDICHVTSDDVHIYNAAEWTKDALFVLEKLTKRNHKKRPSEKNINDSDNSNINNLSDDEITFSDASHGLRRKNIKRYIEETLGGKMNDGEIVLPIVCGGTMMYIQWLVHGVPDALKPTSEAVNMASQIVTEYQNCDGVDGGWQKAVDYVASFHPLFSKRVSSLLSRDWYRLRRILEVAFTVFGTGKNNNSLYDGNNVKIQMKILKNLYMGKRKGGIDPVTSSYFENSYSDNNPIYDVRCFFLCPDDRVAHANNIDERCEEMILKGLINETYNLYFSGRLPTGVPQSLAIGYRQTLDYIQSKKPREEMENDRIYRKQKLTENTVSEKSLNKITDYNDLNSFFNYLDKFTSATRQYAAKQMKWFRKDYRFNFIPVSSHLTENKFQSTIDIIEQMCIMYRDDYEKLLQSTCRVTNNSINIPNELFENISVNKGTEINKKNISISLQTRVNNKLQGMDMKFFVPRRHILSEGSKSIEKVISQADELTYQMETYMDSLSKRPHLSH